MPALADLNLGRPFCDGGAEQKGLSRQKDGCGRSLLKEEEEEEERREKEGLASETGSSAIYELKRKGTDEGMEMR